MSNRRGFTLIELSVAMAVFSVAAAVFFSLLLTGWGAYQQRMTRAHLWHEANVILEHMTTDMRHGQSIEILEDAQKKTLRISNPEGDLVAMYTMRENGLLEMDREGSGTVIQPLTGGLNFSESYFSNDAIGRALWIQIQLEESLFSGLVSIAAATVVYPRN